MDKLPELDRPQPEDPHFLNEEERMGLLFMLSKDYERQNTAPSGAWPQEFEFLMRFIAAPPQELRLATANHLRLMIAHAAGWSMQEHEAESDQYVAYDRTRNRICEAVIESLGATPIQSIEDLRHSEAWQNAYIDLIAHVGEKRDDYS